MGSCCPGFCPSYQAGSKGWAFSIEARLRCMRCGSRGFATVLVTVALVEARQELAHGKIPGAAEDDEVERLDRDQTCSHEALLSQSLPGTRGKTRGNRNPLIRLCFLNIAVDSIPGRTQVLRQVAQQPRAR